MRARWLCLAAVTLAAAPAGCGGVGTSGAEDVSGDQLSIYSSLPLQGPLAPISEQIVNGERLALAASDSRVGPFNVSYVSLDDANPSNGQLDPEATATDARMAAQDTSTIAYIGDFSSAATAVSLPLINGAGILQVSPASPYVGLTSSQDAGLDEPERFYPSGRRTFARLQPGDPTQAAAQVRLMRLLGVRKVYLLDDQNPFEVPLAEIVASDAERAGIAVAAHDSLATTAGSAFSGEAEKVLASGAQAVFLAGDASEGAAALWRALHRTDPGALLLGSSSLIGEAFLTGLGAAGPSTYLTTPVLAPGDYPAATASVLGDYRRHFGGDPGPYALFGYEAMSVVLGAIRSAGRRGNDRRAVIDRLFATKDRESVIGRYSIEVDGETTLSQYGVDRVVGGRAAFYRAFDVG